MTAKAEPWRTANAESAVEYWNKNHPAGTPVYVVKDNSAVEACETTSEAWSLGGRAVVKVSAPGIRGGYMLSRVTPAPTQSPPHVAEMLEALRITASNIRSLGPAGALDRVPEPYREWLAIEEAASKPEAQPRRHDGKTLADWQSDLPAGPYTVGHDECLKIKDAFGDTIATMMMVHLRGRRRHREVAAAAALFADSYQLLAAHLTSSHLTPHSLREAAAALSAACERRHDSRHDHHLKAITAAQRALFGVLTGIPAAKVGDCERCGKNHYDMTRPTVPTCPFTPQRTGGGETRGG